jgi:hypothetical protein
MQKFTSDGYRFLPEIIRRAIWFYLRFTLILRDVENFRQQRRVLDWVLQGPDGATSGIADDEGDVRFGKRRRRQANRKPKKPIQSRIALSPGPFDRSIVDKI